MYFNSSVNTLESLTPMVISLHN